MTYFCGHSGGATRYLVFVAEPLTSGYAGEEVTHQAIEALDMFEGSEVLGGLKPVQWCAENSGHLLGRLGRNTRVVRRRYDDARHLDFRQPRRRI